MQTLDVRKAAILLLSLPDDQAAGLMGKLEPKQVEVVSIEMAKLGAVTGDEQETTIKDFANANPGGMGVRAGGLDVVKQLVERAMGKGGTATYDNVRQSIEAVPFGFLQKVDSQNLLTFIMDEHPQTIALILSYLAPQKAAEIISELPPERQMAVVRRVATMGQTSPEIIKEVERGLELRMASVMSQSFSNTGGVSSVAGMLNVIDRATERSLLENLARENPELVDEIRRLMFVFDDINKLTNKDIQILLKNVDSSQWAMALKGANPELKEKILGNMSKRAAEMLREEMEYLGPVKLSAVEQMQQQIVDAVRRLEDAGEITTQSDEQEEELVQ